MSACRNKKYCSADFELVVRFETLFILVLFFFEVMAHLLSQEKKQNTSFLLLFYYIFRVRYSQTAKFLHLVHNEIP